MIKDIEHRQGVKTVVCERSDRGSGPVPLTDFASSALPNPSPGRLRRDVYSASAEVFSSGLNALVAAASVLLSQVVRLKHGRSDEDLHALHKTLTHGLQNFELQALHSGVEAAETRTAHYVLCTVIDEAVVTADCGKGSQWSQMSLLSSLHNETFGGEKFFGLLDLMSKNPARHLEVLELMYLCLSLGFEGKYRLLPRGVLELEAIHDTLYRQIRQLRGDVPRELSPHWEGLSNQRRNLVHVVPGWLVVLFTALCLVVMYSGFAWVLSEQRDTVLQPYQPFDPAAVQPQPQP